MKKSKLFLKLFLILLIAMPVLNGCKKDKGAFFVYRITATTQRDFIKDTSYVAAKGDFAADNHVAGKLSTWEFEIFTEDDQSIIKITSDNYKQLPFELDVTSTSAQGYSIGYVQFVPSTTIQGDIFDGKVPKKIIFRAKIIDQNDFETEIVSAAVVNHYIVKEDS